jgi:hypothetical protein
MSIPVPKPICDFFNLRYDVKLSKSSILSKFYTYIRDTQLRNKYNKLLIHMDVPLKNLFNINYVNTLDTKSFVDQINKLYKENRHDKYIQLEETEKELLEKLELVREQKRLNEIITNKNYVIHQFIKNSNYYFNEDEAKNLIFYFSEKEYHPISHYLTINDKNLLVSLQLLNRFATEQQIRYEDAEQVIRDYLFSIKITNKFNNNEETTNIPKFL